MVSVGLVIALYSVEAGFWPKTGEGTATISRIRLVLVTTVIHRVTTNRRYVAD